MAVWSSVTTGLRGLFDRGFDPARSRRLPITDRNAQSNVRGLYLIGEIAGTPLIKLGLNRGRAVIDHLVEDDLAAELGSRAATMDLAGRVHGEVTDAWSPHDAVGDGAYDVVIVGAGSSGLGAADRCQQLGLRYVVIEQERPAQLIRNFTKAKPLYMEPPNEENQTRLFCEECPKEELLAQWDRQIVELGLASHIHEFETVEDIQRHSDRDAFTVTTDKGTYETRRVILAIGMAGNPRKLNVAGELEHAARISQNVADPDDYHNQFLVVFGAGDIACEAAIALADRGNHIVMVAPDREFTFPKQRNIDAVMEHAKDGRIVLRHGHRADAIDAETVTIRDIDADETETIRADHIFRCIGANLPLRFFDRIGVRLEGTWTLGRWALLVATFLLCYFIYGAKSSPALWPFGIPSTLFGGASFAEWWGHLHVGEGRWSFKLNGSFWYSLGYCLAMTIFGMKAYHRWGVKYDDSYQRKRFATLIIVQWSLAFMVPMVLMWWLHGMWPDNKWLGWRDNWWHASGFEYAFPLFFWQFFWDVGWIYLIYGLVATFVIIPITTIRHGKRYCTWFCGCGGLAETLGDPWRHLAPKGKVAARWEWMNLAVLIWAIVAGGLVATRIGFGYWVTGEAFVAPTTANTDVVTAKLFWGYQVIADIWLVGIIPVALYPIFGGKIWCRYWCPLAKWMQMTSKWFGTLQISSNEKCITCGECSRYCEVGIDVMAFAKNQLPFHNENTSCIQCGVCITVCPMDVLTFDNERRGTVTSRLFGPAVPVTIEGLPL